jgi:hypothetical protein
MLVPCTAGSHLSIQERYLAKKLFKGFIHVSKKLRAVGLAWLGIKWFRSPSWNCVDSWKLNMDTSLDWIGLAVNGLVLHLGTV